MNIACSECDTRYRVDEAALAGVAKWMTCRKCGARTLVQPPDRTPQIPVSPVASGGEPAAEAPGGVGKDDLGNGLGPMAGASGAAASTATTFARIPRGAAGTATLETAAPRPILLLSSESTTKTAGADARPRIQVPAGLAEVLVPEIGALVDQIDRFNRVWHSLRGRNSGAAALSCVHDALRARKGELQVRLLRTWPNRCRLFLASADENHGEPMLTLRLAPPVELPNGNQRSDANHLPLRVAEALLTAAELAHMLERHQAPTRPPSLPAEVL